MRLRPLAPCVLLLALVGLAGQASAASHVDEAAEARMFGALNRARLAAGLPALERDERLAVLARYHSADMALSGFVATRSPTAGSIIERAALRLGLQDATRIKAHVATGAAALADARPLLDATLTRVGVGVVGDGDHMYVTLLAVSERPDTAALAAWLRAGLRPGRPIDVAAGLLRRRLGFLAR